MKKTLLKISIALLFVSQSAFAAINPSDSLIVHYPFDGNTNDVSGNGNNAVQSGGVTYVADTQGNPNAAIQFDGIDDFLTIAASASMKFPDAISFSIATRIKALPSPASTYSMIFVRYGCTQPGASADVIGLSYDNKNVPGFSLRSTSNQDMIGSGDITGAYHDLILIKNMKKKTFSLYIDGVLIKSAAISLPTTANIANIAAWIGKSEYCAVAGQTGISQYFYKGIMDDFKIYARALTDQEIGVPVVDADLILHYPFNGNTIDFSPYGNNATQSGGITYVADSKGTANAAVQFDGIDDFLIIPASTSMKFPDATSFSIVTRIKAVSTSSTYSQIFNRYGCPQTGGPADVISAAYDNKNIPTFGIRSSTSQSLSGSSDITGAYHNLICIKDMKANKMSMYIDGVLVASQTITINTANVANIAAWIGKSEYCTVAGQSGASQFFYKGIIDDFKIYKRALSTTEINDLELTTAITDEEESALSFISPNPSNTLFKLSSTSASSVKVLNVNGVIVDSFDTEQNAQFGQTYQAGVYFVHVLTNGKSKVYKLIKY